MANQIGTTSFQCMGCEKVFAELRNLKLHAGSRYVTGKPCAELTYAIDRLMTDTQRAQGRVVSQYVNWPPPALDAGPGPGAAAAVDSDAESLASDDPAGYPPDAHPGSDDGCGSEGEQPVYAKGMDAGLAQLHKMCSTGHFNRLDPRKADLGKDFRQPTGFLVGLSRPKPPLAIHTRSATEVYM